MRSKRLLRWSLAVGQCLIAIPLHSNLGETLPELQERYGRGKPTEIIKPAKDARRYEPQGFVIEVQFLNHKSCLETIRKTNGDFSDRDIHNILSGSAPASEWKSGEVSGAFPKTWKRSDELAFAEHGVKDQVPYVKLESIQWRKANEDQMRRILEAAQAAQKAKADKAAASQPAGQTPKRQLFGSTEEECNKLLASWSPVKMPTGSRVREYSNGVKLGIVFKDGKAAFIYVRDQPGSGANGISDGRYSELLDLIGGPGVKQHIVKGILRDFSVGDESLRP